MAFKVDSKIFMDGSTLLAKFGTKKPSAIDGSGLTDLFPFVTVPYEASNGKSLTV
ncbi:hypothetical protein BFO01nite_50840 [Brevibacillus formosus]|uniref:Phage tail protein n=1 Tax=Brevibacillus formosus TaxID=54913 RepID=A0ABQ0TDA4_9BACL|nr:hypothetical protein BFO01nite_50840 [Brevibacillus formosus]